MFKTRTKEISFADAERYIQNNTLAELGRSLEQEEYYQLQTAQVKTEWASMTDFILHDKFSFDFVEENNVKRVPHPAAKLPLQVSAASSPVYSSANTSKSTTILRLCCNDHPYYFTDDVTHLVLWKLGEGRVTEQEQQAAVASLLRRVREGRGELLKSRGCGRKIDEGGLGSFGGRAAAICVETETEVGTETDADPHVCAGSLEVVRWVWFQNPPALMSIPDVQHAHLLVQVQPAPR